nr:nucleocapsid protein [Ji'an nairovirus]
MSLPVSQLTFTDKGGLNKWYKDFKESLGFDLYSTYTYSESMCKEIHDAYVTAKCSENKQKDAEIAKVAHARLQNMAPIYECAWASCDGVVRRSYDWFEKNADKEYMKWAKEYEVLKKSAPTVEQVVQYQQAALAWRKAVKFEINDYTAASTDSVVKIYRVGADIVTDIQDLLKDMQRRRNLALKIEPGQKRVPAEHIEHFRDWLAAKDWTAPCPWGSWKKKNNNGVELATTACAGLINKRYRTRAQLEKELGRIAEEFTALGEREEFDKKFCLEMAAFFGGLWNSANAFMAGAAGQVKSSGFVQQGSAIDTVFSSHFWAWKSQVKPELFPSLSSMLFNLGKAPQGKTKVEKKLKECPFTWAQKMSELFAKVEGDAIHMHPGVLTPSRICSDMVCSFGAFPVQDPKRIREGSSSPRFLLNLRSDGVNPAAKTVCALFREYKQQYENWEDQEIVPVEHMLHQSFLSKHGPFVNVYQVEGLALAVNIQGIN